MDSPPTGVRVLRPAHQEKKLRKRRELDALVRDAAAGGGGLGRKHRRVGAAQQLLHDTSSSSESGPEDGGVVWRGGGGGVEVVRGRQRSRLWAFVRWAGISFGVVMVLGLVVWLHLATRLELDLVRKYIVRGLSSVNKVCAPNKSWTRGQFYPKKGVVWEICIPFLAFVVDLEGREGKWKKYLPYTSDSLNQI